MSIDSAGTTSQQARRVYMIGHSNLETDVLVERLRGLGANTLVDLRSQPYSRWVPQHNRENVRRAIELAGIEYRFMGDRLGGRPEDPALYPGGDAEARPDYDRVAASDAFREALAQLVALLRAPSTSACLMCSEGDYRECHRHLLVAPALRAAAPELFIWQVKPDGQVEEDREQPRQMSLF